MQKVKYTFPFPISIQENFHQVAEKAYSEHFIERVSSSLSATERANKTLSLLYANDIVNLINQLSHRLRKQKVYKKQLVGFLKQYHVLPNADISIEVINQLAKENLKNIQTSLALQRNVFEALELIMSEESADSQRKKEIVQKIKENEGRTFISFLDYLQRNTIKLNSQKITNFMTSLSNLSEIEQVKFHFKTLNETQRKFFEPICNIYEQYINTQFELQSQIQKKSSSIRSFFSFNKVKQAKEQIIKKGSEKRQQTEPHKQQSQSYELIIKKLQSEIDEYKKKDRQYSKLYEQNERYRSQIQKLKFSMVSEEQQQHKQYQVMIPFQAVTKQLQADLAFYKKQLQATKIRLEKMQGQSQSKQYGNISDEMQYLRQSNTNYSNQIDKLENQNYLLRLNQGKYKNNYALLQRLLKQYEQEQKLLQKQLSSWKELVQSNKHSSQMPQHKQNNRQEIEGEAIQDISKDPSDNIHQVSEQNSRLRHQISLIEQRLARLSQTSQLMASTRQQKITSLQLKILDLTRQLARQ